MASKNMVTDTPPEIIDLTDEVNEDEDNGEERNISTNSGESDGSPAPSVNNPGGDGGEVGGDPELTEMLRKQFENFSKSLQQEVNEAYDNLKDSDKSQQNYVKSLEEKVKEQQSKLKDYERQLQEERAENARKFAELEETANLKELLLRKELEFAQRFTWELRSKLYELRASEEEKSERIGQLEFNELVLGSERSSLESAVSNHKWFIKYLEERIENCKTELVGLQEENKGFKTEVKKLTKDLETEKGAREKLQMDYNELERNMVVPAEHLENTSVVLKTPKGTGNLSLKFGSLVNSDRPDSSDGMIPGPSAPPETVQKRKLLGESGTKDIDAGGSGAKIRRNADSSSDDHFGEAQLTTGQNGPTIPRGRSEIRVDGGPGTPKPTGSPRKTSRLGGAGNMDDVASDATTSTHPDP